ncbi:minichromosome maintenance domain-containing protein 2-like isoform X1 [Mytilus trossulus]|uniref:minichromosome maintenance domain-containing protein 2-like isoform X1 n=2 Tax=Mytilus trossulus TaxID=6551 RepID=UPI0030043A3C
MTKTMFTQGLHSVPGVFQFMVASYTFISWMSFESLDKKLKMIYMLVEYLETSGNIRLIRQQCARYSQNKGLLVYTFRLLIDPVLLTEVNAELGNSLLNSPNDVIFLVKEVVFQIVTLLELLPSDVTFPQISVIIRLNQLPSLCQSNTIQSSTDLSRLSSIHGFVQFTGIVIGMTAPSKYTQSTKYRCPDEECEGHHGNQFIRVHVTGASETQTIRSDFSCTFCWRRLEEEKSCRYLSEKMVIEVVPDKLDSCGEPNSYRIQAIPVYLRDDITRGVELGEKYNVIGLIRKDIMGENIMLAIEANNIMKVTSETIPKFSTEIPKNITDLYEDCKSSPWSFVLNLAYSFADQICPPGTYIRLKMCILLSLVTLLDKQDNGYPLHLLAVGQDTLLIHRLLMYGKQFAVKTCNHTSTNHMSGKVTCDKYESSPYFIEAGSFHLAKNGVCYIGDIERYKKSTKEQIQSGLGQRKFSIDISSRYTGGLPQQLEETLSCHVWGYTQPFKQRQSNDPFKGLNINDSSNTLLECFSVVHFTDYGSSNTNEQVYLQCAHHQLTLAMGHNLKSNISDENFHKFLRYVKSICPKMTEECEGLLHGYYLASRKTRSSESNSKVPVSALKTLYSLSMSHARLSLRSEITVEDGLMAIWIYEESLTERLGHSLLSLQPCPHVQHDNKHQYLGKENDHMMRQFHVNLIRFCNNQQLREE